MFRRDRRYDVMYFDKEQDTDVLWLRTPYFFEMIKAVAFLIGSCECVTIRIRDVSRYSNSMWRN